MPPPLPNSQKILIAPLCWGLGHATRCIPLIQHYIMEGKTVVLASDTDALALLRTEFPTLTSLELPTYNITYKSHNIFKNVIIQLPHILKSIVAEHFALRKIIAAHHIDTLISDNRYGCFTFFKYFSYCKRNIFITHQINIKINTDDATFNLFSLLEYSIGFLHRLYMNCFFDTTWIPDYESEQASLAGGLSHGKLPRNHVFIGVLTRFQLKNKAQTQYLNPQAQRKKVAVVLSGPEPQRSFLEEIILAQASTLTAYDFTIVQGKPNAHRIHSPFEHLQIRPFLAADTLFILLENSDFIVTRAGYSTLMDLSVLQKPVLLIPTPGQTEQEYLANRFKTKENYTIQQQNELDLARVLVSQFGR